MTGNYRRGSVNQDLVDTCNILKRGRRELESNYNGSQWNDLEGSRKKRTYGAGNYRTIWIVLATRN